MIKKCPYLTLQKLFLLVGGFSLNKLWCFFPLMQVKSRTGLADLLPEKMED
jgi:hypothetical protein